MCILGGSGMFCFVIPVRIQQGEVAVSCYSEHMNKRYHICGHRSSIVIQPRRVACLRKGEMRGMTGGKRYRLMAAMMLRLIVNVLAKKPGKSLVSKREKRLECKSLEGVSISKARCSPRTAVTLCPRPQLNLLYSISARARRQV